eukprot:CAMPEP_0174350996 /NCGR_PEP_ID=MMETSP0811_2-20130205/8225_1 /TAXON_ID=73025 ORGANISM="Eutreptiella gymnastica-like, Strain CCMP1594" /NCGR_SAMPLE_ID=MMETSP0811_2 /ASSEMBLY_ACC=CAM_ASM_000667 /LENGTH=219 /DNA_ID=CAMNT_0015479803 /DNA_START=210 /DNA_END=869 /DNA_ORIENTATION=-
MVTAANVLPGGLYGTPVQTDAKGYQFYRMEYWLSTSHIVETALAVSHSLHILESLVFFDYNAFDAPRVRTARPSGSDGNVGRVASVSGSESTFAALRTEVVGSNIPEAEEVFVDRDTHMFRLVVLPNSTALGVAASHQSGKPDVRKQALGAAGASSLRQEVRATYFGKYGSHVPNEMVDIVLNDTINDVFADPVVKQTIVEEVMKKLCPRPPHYQTPIP